MPFEGLPCLLRVFLVAGSFWNRSLETCHDFKKVTYDCNFLSPIFPHHDAFWKMDPNVMSCLGRSRTWDFSILVIGTLRFGDLIHSVGPNSVSRDGFLDHIMFNEYGWIPCCFGKFCCSFQLQTCFAITVYKQLWIHYSRQHINSCFKLLHQSSSHVTSTCASQVDTPNLDMIWWHNNDISVSFSPSSFASNYWACGQSSWPQHSLRWSMRKQLLGGKHDKTWKFQAFLAVTHTCWYLLFNVHGKNPWTLHENSSLKETHVAKSRTVTASAKSKPPRSV